MWPTLKSSFKDPAYYHSRILLAFMGISTFLMGLAVLFLPAGTSFLLDFPFFNFPFFAVCALLVVGSFYVEILRAHLKGLTFITAIVFSLYLSFGVYVTQLDFYIMRYYWVFAALGGICFSRKIYIIAFFAVAYTGTSIVHFFLPEEALFYPIWSYLTLTPPLMIIYFYLISQSIAKNRKLMENEITLRQKTEELDTILNTLNAMVAFKDGNNVYKKVNQAMAQFLGMTKEDAEGKSLYDLIPNGLAKKFHEEDLLIMEAGKPSLHKLEKVVSPATRQTLWFRSSKFPYINEMGKVAGVVFSSEDVTNQVLAEEKLKESEERFRMIFENAPDGMALIENPDWHFIKINRAMTGILGYEEDEIMKLSPFDLVHPGDLHICEKLHHDVMFGDLTHDVSEKRYIHKNGKIVHCSLSVIVVQENGQPKYLIASIKDITQQKESANRLKQYARQLEESNQNLQEFAYAASHDLREPLRTVVSYVQLLKRQLPEAHVDQNTHEFMEFVVGGAKRMENQILALLDYSRVGKGDLELTSFDLKDAVENVCLGLRKQMIDHRVVIEMETIPPIIGDRFQIEGLLQNLLSNAIKYRSPDRTPHIFISSRDTDQAWQITVADNGIGIEEEFLEKIFAVFRRLHSADKIPGTGIGLALCRRIVQRHGGKIWATSVPGKGTSFHLTLPKTIINGEFDSSFFASDRAGSSTLQPA